MKNVKNFARFLIESGLVFEINRRVLHPVGLSLLVDLDSNNKRKLIISSLIETDDPEGFVFDQENFDLGTEKYEKFLEKRGQERITSRRNKFGFIEQNKGV